MMALVLVGQPGDLHIRYACGGEVFPATTCVAFLRFPAKGGRAGYPSFDVVEAHVRRLNQTMVFSNHFWDKCIWPANGDGSSDQKRDNVYYIYRLCTICCFYRDLHYLRSCETT